MKVFRSSALAVALIAGSSLAQPAPPKVYSNKVTFALPVKLSERDAARLAELKFCVRPIVPGRTPEWFLVETAVPTKSKFSFTAAGEGEYWFQFVTVDKQGNTAPADLDREPPALIVVVDTTPPDVEVRTTSAASGEVLLQAIVRDPNADPAGLKLEVPTRDRGWKALEPMGESGVFRVPDPALLKGTVRVTAFDKARNKTIREIDLGQPLVTTKAVAPTPVPTPEPPTLAAMPRVVERPSTSGPSLPSPHATSPVPRILLNSTRVSLDYALDAASVSRVEGYCTRDNGRTWTRFGEDAKRRSPFDFELPEDGVYGVSLVVSTSNRPGTPPSPGDQPDCWIEVDTTKPVVQVRDIQLGGGDDSGMILVNWSASDPNLTTEPVTVSYAGQPEGPWQPIAKGLKGEGAFRWPVPASVGSRVYLRVEAVDKAGNVGRWETREPIILETTRPKARVLGATAKP